MKKRNVALFVGIFLTSSCGGSDPVVPGEGLNTVIGGTESMESEENIDSNMSTVSGAEAEMENNATLDQMGSVLPIYQDGAGVMYRWSRPQDDAAPVATSGKDNAYGDWIGNNLVCVNREGGLNSNYRYNEDGTWSATVFRLNGEIFSESSGIWGVFDIEYSDGLAVPMLYRTTDASAAAIGAYNSRAHIEMNEGLGIANINLTSSAVARAFVLDQMEDNPVCEIDSP